MMLSWTKRILITLLAVWVLAGAGCSAMLLHSEKRSLLVYESFPTRDRIVNWVVDMDTGEKWQVGNPQMEAGGWSPSGKYMLFYSFEPRTVIQIADAMGKGVRQIFDEQDYPDVEVKGMCWLAGDVLLLRTYDHRQRIEQVRTLDIHTGAFDVLAEGAIMQCPSRYGGKIWLHATVEGDELKYVLMNREGERVPVPVEDSLFHKYFFSPDGKQWAYFCDKGKGKTTYAICLANVNMDGVSNKRVLIRETLPPDVLPNLRGMWWAPDGKYIGIHIFNTVSEEHQFHVIDVSSGKVVISKLFPTRTRWDLWSPRGEEVMDQDGVWLDLQTGEVRNFFDEVDETARSYIVDWRLIEVSK
ncbi:hypothetical protein D6833_06325 [Candidatus Parcubacteria bacterium]|nr:MAG: hypothetical protein D6833_06325 [Candidatus Parcubacteria bacterium]